MAFAAPAYVGRLGREHDRLKWARSEIAAWLERLPPEPPLTPEREAQLGRLIGAALDKRIVALLNERASLAREAGAAKAAAGRRAIRDADREREILLRVTMANEGPLPQADLLALYRRLFIATRTLEARDRDRQAGRDGRRGGDGDDRPT